MAPPLHSAALMEQTIQYRLLLAQIEFRNAHRALRVGGAKARERFDHALQAVKALSAEAEKSRGNSR